jgi:hypothetical protein
VSRPGIDWTGGRALSPDQGTLAQRLDDIDGSADESCECGACEGSGRIPRGEFGAYRRDGEKYEMPGLEVCEACNGEGRVS